VLQIVIHSGFKYLVLPSEKEKEAYTRVDEVDWSPIVPLASQQLSEIRDTEIVVLLSKVNSTNRDLQF
jgi:hypothetical protein